MARAAGRRRGPALQRRHGSRPAASAVRAVQADVQERCARSSWPELCERLGLGGAGRAAREGLEHGGGQGRDDHSARGPTSPERGQLQLRARASDGCAVFATLVETMQMRRDDEMRARCVASIDAVYGGLCESTGADRWPALQDRAFRIESLARSSFLEAQRLFSPCPKVFRYKRPVPSAPDGCEGWQSGLASNL